MSSKKPARGRPPHDDVLTPAEWRIAHAVKHGMSNREIARGRGISADAVKFHVGNVLAKLGFSSRHQANLPTLPISCTGMPMAQKNGWRSSKIRTAGRLQSCRRSAADGITPLNR